MSEDARFEDGVDRPLRLIAEDAEDLQVLSSLVQDAVFPVGDMRWHASKRRFAMLVNRFRWEDATLTRQRDSAFERVRCVLAFDDVKHVSAQGVDRSDAEMVMSLLAVDWQPAEDGTGRLELTLAGDGAVALDVECINATLQDVTRPYLAPSGKKPEHPE
ncbi:MAG: DUF2948 family protein [Pseudomonadota bacterium]